MKSLATRISLCMFFLLLVTSIYAQTDTLTVIFITDTHSHLYPYGEKDETGKGIKGGLARAATLIKTLGAEEKNPLLVHSGDLFVGDFLFNKFFGVPEFKILQDLGLRVMTIGNHEFDLGPDRLKASIHESGIAESSVDLLTANVDMSGDPDLATLVKPYTILNVGNIKVGLFGLTPPMANSFSNPAPDSITNFIKAAQAAVDSLRPNCDLVIGLTHLDVAHDDSLAANVPGIDVIIGGHAHVHNTEPRIVETAEGSTAILRAGCFYQFVGMVRIAVSPNGTEILHHELMPVDNNTPEDTAVAAKVDSLIAEVEADPRYGPVYSEVIGQSDSELSHSSGFGFKDAPLGNLVTDAIRNATGTQIALDVHGWLGQPLCAGTIVGNDILQSIPYGYDPETGYCFNVVKFQLTGMLLRSALEYAINESLSDPSFEIQISNAQIIYDSREPMGQKIKSITVGGQPISYFTPYTISMSDGLANYLALAGLSMVVPEETGLVEYLVVRDFIKNNSPIDYGAEGRIQDEAETSVSSTDDQKVPIHYELHQNYPNPFNPATTITFELFGATNAELQTVHLDIYNLVGEKITTLVNETLPAGVYQTIWDGSDANGKSATSGIYIYRIRIGNFMTARKMIFAR